MIGLDIGFSKKNFFDRQAVIDRLSPAERRVLSKFGAFVRQAARKSIRYHKNRISAPGRPPHAHTKSAEQSIKKILFAYQAATHSVVIGPVLLNGQRSIRMKLPAGKTVPALLEYGGRAEQRAYGRGQPSRPRRVHYRPRPFMRPAYEKEKEVSLPSMWRDALTRS